MASPLIKRFPRELKNNLGKYLGIFLLMAVSIALTSGFLLAAHSISVIIDEMPEKYLIEDGRFTTAFEATDAQLDTVRDTATNSDAKGASIYENFAFDCDFTQPGGDNDRSRTVRVYTHRTEVDLAAYAQGEAPQTDDEIAIDRVFAKNNGVSVGDPVRLAGRDFTVCGIMTTADNQALFENNSDFTVNTLSFGVAEVSAGGFATLAQDGREPTYLYSFTFDNADLTLAERTDIEKDMVKALTQAGATVEDLTDADANQGIGYAADDVEGDSSMWVTLLYIIIAIMAFVFVVLTSSTIEEESAIIGTLLASGYRRRELVAHYLALPAAVGIAAAAVGNVVGYTWMSGPMRDLYYGSYSLPPYYATWSWGVFAETTAVPVAVLVGVTLIGLVRKMRHTPLAFLRHETSKGGVKRGLPLPERLSFPARFRLRVFLRNLGNFATLFVGIGFASLLLLFSLAVLPTMTHYAENLHNNVVAEHQYTLKAPLELEVAAGASQGEAAGATADGPQAVSAQAAESTQATTQANTQATENAHPVNSTDNGAEKIAQAEKYAVYQLEYDRGNDNGTEFVTVYGVAQNSRYWDGIAVGDGRVAFGAGLVDKFGFTDGQTISLYDKYEDVTHEITYEGTPTWGTKSDMAVYMSLDDFNRFFGNDEGYFNAYASDEALELDARYLASDLTPSDMDAIGDQFVDMMDGMIGMLVGLSVFIFLVFMYLLTKSIIDRSARAISYMKVFGYRDGEISRLYVRSITLTVAVSLVVCQPLIIGGLTLIFRSMLLAYSGNIEIYVPTIAIAEVIAIGFATYLAVALAHVHRIKQVPLALALKVQE